MNWYKFAKGMSYSEALQVFGFPAGSSPTPQDVKKKYYQLVMVHHPDKGGKHEKMVEVNNAKEVLDLPKPAYESPWGKPYSGYSSSGPKSDPFSDFWKKHKQKAKPKPETPKPDYSEQGKKIITIKVLTEFNGTVIPKGSIGTIVESHKKNTYGVHTTIYIVNFEKPKVNGVKVPSDYIKPYVAPKPYDGPKLSVGTEFQLIKQIGSFPPGTNGVVTGVTDTGYQADLFPNGKWNSNTFVPFQSVKEHNFTKKKEEKVPPKQKQNSPQTLPKGTRVAILEPIKNIPAGAIGIIQPFMGTQFIDKKPVRGYLVNFKEYNQFNVYVPLDKVKPA